MFFGSLLFDFDQVQWLRTKASRSYVGFKFESARANVDNVRGILRDEACRMVRKPARHQREGQFSASLKRQEEDKLVGYLSFLKIGLRCCASSRRKAKDLRNWLTVYGYEPGGRENVGGRRVRCP